MKRISPFSFFKVSSFSCSVFIFLMAFPSLSWGQFSDIPPQSKWSSIEIASSSTVHLYSDDYNLKRQTTYGKWLNTHHSLLGKRALGPLVAKSLGSGLVLSPQGYVVTNAHLVRGVGHIRAVINRKKYRAYLLAIDPFLDLALLKIDSSASLESFTLQASHVRPGLSSIALGFPARGDLEVNEGIITKSFYPRPQAHRWQFYMLTNMHHFQALDGGPVISQNGHILGMTQLAYDKKGRVVNHHTVVPISILYASLRSFLAGHFFYSHPWIGLEFDKKDGHEGSESSLVVSDVALNSPGYFAGLEKGDVVYEITPVEKLHPSLLQYFLRTGGKGDQWHISYRQKGIGRIFSTSLKLEYPKETVPFNRVKINTDSILKDSTLGNLSPRINQLLGLPLHSKGVVLVTVSPLSRRLGFQEGDILRTIDGRSFWFVKDIRGALQRKEEHIVSLIRSGKMITCYFRMGNNGRKNNCHR